VSDIGSGIHCNLNMIISGFPGGHYHKRIQECIPRQVQYYSFSALQNLLFRMIYFSDFLIVTRYILPERKFVSTIFIMIGINYFILASNPLI
jgi:hypothetical protein